MVLSIISYMIKYTIPTIKFIQHALQWRPCYGASSFQPPWSLHLRHSSAASPLRSFWGTLSHSPTSRCWLWKACQYCLSHCLVWYWQQRQRGLHDAKNVEHCCEGSLWGSLASARHRLTQPRTFSTRQTKSVGSWETSSLYSMGMPFLCMQLSGVRDSDCYPVGIQSHTILR